MWHSCVALRTEFPIKSMSPMAWMVLPDRIELSTSPLPRECSTTELRQQTGHRGNRPSRAATKRGRFLPQGLPRCKRGGRVSRPRMGRRRTKSVRILAIMHKCLGPGLIQAGGRPVARRDGGLPVCRNLPIRAGDAGRGGTYLCRRLRAWSLLWRLLGSSLAFDRVAPIVP